MLRFAPSPTKDMDINQLRIAIINYIVAEQKNEGFLVRIEDADKTSSIEGKDTEIMMLLEKFALKHSSVFHQSEHLNLHQTLALRLLKEEKAFICKCSGDSCSSNCENLGQDDYATLKKSGEPFVIRLKQPTDEIVFTDLFHGEIKSTAQTVDSLVILTNEGIPSQNFATASDDMMSDIDFIIRDEKYLVDTPKQIHIKNILGYKKAIIYAHLPAITYDEETSLAYLFKEGFVPDAILNYLILLSSSHAPKEVFTLPDAIEWFKLEELPKTPVAFELEKLRSINREHLRLMDDRELSTLFGFADADIGKLAKLYLKEASTISELETKIRAIFSPKTFPKEHKEKMKLLSDIIFNAPAFETYEKFLADLVTKSGLDEAEIITPLRHLLTNQGDGPKLSEIYPFIKSYILEVAA